MAGEELFKVETIFDASTFPAYVATITAGIKEIAAAAEAAFAAGNAAEGEQLLGQGAILQGQGEAAIASATERGFDPALVEQATRTLSTGIESFQAQAARAAEILGRPINVVPLDFETVIAPLLAGLEKSRLNAIATGDLLTEKSAAVLQANLRAGVAEQRAGSGFAQENAATLRATADSAQAELDSALAASAKAQQAAAKAIEKEAAAKAKTAVVAETEAVEAEAAPKRITLIKPAAPDPATASAVASDVDKELAGVKGSEVLTEEEKLASADEALAELENQSRLERALNALAEKEILFREKYIAAQEASAAEQEKTDKELARAARSVVVAQTEVGRAGRAEERSLAGEAPPPTIAEEAGAKNALFRRQQEVTLSQFNGAEPGPSLGPQDATLKGDAELVKRDFETQVRTNVAQGTTPDNITDTATANLAERRNALAVKIDEAILTEQGDIDAKATANLSDARVNAKVKLEEFNQATAADIEATTALRIKKQEELSQVNLGVKRATLGPGRDEYNAVQRQLAEEEAPVLGPARAEYAAVLRKSAAAEAELAPGRAEYAAVLRKSAADIAVTGAKNAEAELSAAQATLAQARAAEGLTVGEKSFAEVIGESRAAIAGQSAAVKVATERQLASSSSFVSDTAEAALLKDATARQVKLKELALAEGEKQLIAEQSAAVEVGTKAAVDRQRSAVVQALLAGDQVELDLLVERQADEKVLNAEIKSRVAAELKQRVAEGTAPKEALAAEGAAARGGLGGIGGGTIALLVGGVALKDIYKSQQDVQQAFVLIKGQLTSLGQGSQIPEVTKQLEDIAVKTGTAEAKVASVFPQILGIFKNTADAVTNTRAATEQAKALGVDLQTLVGQLGPLSLSFKASFREIDDSVINLRDHSGVAANRLIETMSQLGPVAAQSGISLKQLGAIAATVLQDTSRAPQSVAEDFNRLLPQLQANQARLAEDLNGNAAGAAVAPQFLKDVRSGEIGAALDLLIKNYDKLTKSQQEALGKDLGGPRGAKDIDALNQNKDAYLRLEEASNGAGKSAAYFAEVQKTLGFQISQLREKLLQLGRSFLEGGGNTALQDLFTTVTGLINALKIVADVFGTVNGVLRGALGTLIEIAGAVFLVEKAFDKLNKTKLAEGIAKRIGGGAAVDAGVGAAEAGGAFGSRAGFSAAVGGVINPITLMAVSLGALAVKVKNESDKVNAAADGYAAGLTKLSDAEIAARANAPGPGFGERFGAAVTFSPTRQNLDIAEENRRVARSIGLPLALDSVKQLNLPIPKSALPTSADIASYENKGDLDAVGFAEKLRSKGAKEIPDLIKNVNDGVAGASTVAEALVRSLESNPDVSAQIKGKAAALKAAADNKPQTAAQIEQQGADADAAIQDAVDKYANHVGTVGDVLAVMQEKLDTADPSKKAGLQDKLNKFKSQEAVKALDFAESVAGPSNTVGDEKAKIQRELAHFNSGEVPDFTIRLELAKKIRADLLTQNKLEADAAKTTEERDKILREGEVIPPELKAIFATSVDDNPLLASILQGTKDLIPSLKAKLDSGIKDAFAGGEALGDATVAALKIIYDDLVQLQAFEGGLPVYQSQIADAKAAYDRAVANRDKLNITPGVGDTVTGGPQTTPPVTDPTKAADKIQDQTDKAHQTYLNAIGDNVGAAKLGQQIAAQDLANAGNDQLKYWEAKAEQATADKELLAAEQAITKAKLGYLEAVATAKGDPVGADKLKLQAAQQELAAAIAGGETGANLDNLNTAVVNAQAALVNSQITQIESQVSTGIALNRITLAQGIALLRGAEQLAVSQAQKDQIEQQIKGLLKGNQNLQFDIPTDIKLPTLYEARRLSQTPAGQGYTDNRNITINLQPLTNLDLTNATGTIIQAVNARTYGSSGRIGT